MSTACALGQLFKDHYIFDSGLLSLAPNAINDTLGTITFMQYERTKTLFTSKTPTTQRNDDNDSEPTPTAAALVLDV